MGIVITRAALARMYPRALPAWLDAMEKLATPLCEFYGYNRLDWCGIAGQIDAETDGMALASMQENMRFSADRMLKVYSKRLGDCVGVPVPPLGGRVFASKAALARALAGKPKETADVVYGGPRGREGTPPWCGSQFVGRGPLQNTHANNYRASRDEIRRQPGGQNCPDLMEHPELLATDPELGVRDVFAQWKLKGLSKYARRSDWATLSDVLNTGNPNDSVKPFGLPRRLRATATALAIWPAASVEPAPPPLRQVRDGDLAAANANLGTIVAGATQKGKEAVRTVREGDRGQDVKELQEALLRLGYATGPADGVFGVLTTRAVVALQVEHKLKADGIVGRATREAMRVTAPAPGPHNEIVAADLRGSSSTVRFIGRVKTAIAGLFIGNAAVGGDNFFELGLVDKAVSRGEHVKGLVDRSVGLGLPMPSPKLITAAVVAVACVVAWRWLQRAEFGRVLAARRGG